METDRVISQQTGLREQNIQLSTCLDTKYLPSWVQDYVVPLHVSVYYHKQVYMKYMQKWHI